MGLQQGKGEHVSLCRVLLLLVAAVTGYRASADV